mmetsp:Transcript_16542/g.29801  ORF Transcript_16542/g.29801 Transcript_16542/m.29801 type:complete len:91 (-) Transcript_16542:44-316(-)
MIHLDVHKGLPVSSFLNMKLLFLICLLLALVFGAEAKPALLVQSKLNAEDQSDVLCETEAGTCYKYQVQDGTCHEACNVRECSYADYEDC